MTKPQKFPSLILAALIMLAALPSLAESASNINNRNAPSAAAPKFTKVIDDLPLMPGLTAQEEDDVLFIAAPGRIAQTTATGAIDVDEVYNYYERALPQLGWKEINARTYERDNERLRLDVSGSNPEAKTVARFSLEPIATR